MRPHSAHAPRRNPRKLRNRALLVLVLALVMAVNIQPLEAGARSLYNSYEQSRPEYLAQNGAWQVVDFPDEFKINGVHSVLLRTGKVLIVAGSGNNAKTFAAGTFRTLLWDPVANTFKNITTPKDLFCSGHAMLPNGNVLVAGGTKKYEVLAKNVVGATGVMTVHNEAPDLRESFVIPKGTSFKSNTNGLRYLSIDQSVVTPGHRMADGTFMGSSTSVMVQAEREHDVTYAFRSEGRQFSIDGFDRPDVYGIADTITLDKQNFQAANISYEFNPYTEAYEKTGDLTTARWYPSLIGINGGDVLAVSGLDEFGRPSTGRNETFDPKTSTWTDRPTLKRYFPTYPALFRLADGNIGYSGSNTGYGNDQLMRAPGIWNLTDNTFSKIPGLRVPAMNETSSSVLLPPAQDQRVLIAGGGNIGDSTGSTDRADVIDFATKTISPAPNLQQAVRYLSTVVLPDDTVLLTGGSSDYRGRFDSNALKASLYDARINTSRPVAAPTIGRNYHSEALLLPDGRVLTLGSDSLYGDADNQTAGTFEKRIEIYSPPYLFADGARPQIQDAPKTIARGQTFHLRTNDTVAAARLIRPSAVTHVTDTEQRSVALTVKITQGGVDLVVPTPEGLVPSGYYMIFIVDSNGIPSSGRWVQVP